MATIVRLASRAVRVQPTLVRSVSTSVPRMILQRPIANRCLPGSVELTFLKPPASILQAHVRLMSTDPSSIQEVQERVLYFLKLYDKINPEKLTLDLHFMRDLGLDSLDHVEIIIAAENEFGLEISDQEAELLLTPREISEWICEQFDIDE